MLNGSGDQKQRTMKDIFDLLWNPTDCSYEHNEDPVRVYTGCIVYGVFV